MKKELILCAAIISASCIGEAQDEKTGVIYEITLESMTSGSLPDTWDTSQHFITYTDGELNGDDFESTFPVGLGLWFGLHDEDNNLLSSCIVGPQPAAKFTLVSKDIDSNNSESFAVPMTRVDVPFSLSAEITTVSDDTYLQSLAISQVDSEYYSDGLVLQYPNASKCMMFTRELSVTVDDVEQRTLIDRVFTHGDGEIVMQDVDYTGYDPDLDNSVVEVSSGFKPLDTSETVTTTAETDSRVVSVMTTIEGREVFTPHVVTNLNWATDGNGVPLAKDAINFDANDFTEGDGVEIIIHPTAWAMLPRDGGGRLIGGETYYTLPSIKWDAKNLYPRSSNQIALFIGDDVTGIPFATSDIRVNPSDDDVQAMDIFWDLSLDPNVVDRDGVTYTAALRTKTPIDFDGDGSLDDEGWEIIDTVSFSYNREINVNGVVVTSE